MSESESETDADDQQEPQQSIRPTAAHEAPQDNGDIAGAQAIGLFALGVTAGMLVILIAFTLVPEPEDPGVAEFESIRSFAESHFVREVSTEELAARAMHGMLDELDTYSRYYEKSEAEGARRDIEGDFRGIGVIFKAPITDAQILFPVAGSPAEEAGVLVGDRIVEIESESTDGVSGDELRARLTPRGKRYVSVRVLGLDGQTRDLTLEPRVLTDPSVRHVHMIEDAPGVGYLTLRTFSNNTPAEFDDAVMQLKEQGATTLILDLRENRGGVLDAAVHITGRFIEEGVVVSSEGRIHREEHRADDVEPLFMDLKVCVLVDGYSASASEVVAGALQDHRAAVVIGEPTYGKGMLQTTRSFPAFGSRAKVTSGYFYSPSHRNFERTADPDRDYGILPDLTVHIDEALRRQIYRWLLRYDPPANVLDALAAWEDELDESILPDPPDDPQLDAALDLLRGSNPGPRQIRKQRS